MPDVSMSKHAIARANQRGVTHQMIADLIAYADVEEAAGDGCMVLRVSRRQLQDRSIRSSLGVRADQLQSVAVVWSAWSGEVVTVLHDHGGKAGRRYRPAH